MTRTALALLATLSLALAPLEASAQAAAPPKTTQPAVGADEEARRLFEEGEKAFAAGQLERAESAFEASLERFVSHDTAANLGITEIAREKWHEAAAHLDLALRTFPTAGDPKNRDKLKELLTQAKSKSATLSITVNVQGATVLVQGERAGVAPLDGDVYAKPGTISIEAQAPGHTPEKVAVSVEAGLTKSVAITLKPTGQTNGGGGGKALWPTLLLAGVGAAGLGAGIGLTVASIGKYDDAEALYASCQPLAANCVEQGTAALGDADTFMNAGIAMYAVGGAALVGMAIYLAIPESDGAVATSRLVPRLSPTHAGLHFDLSF